MSSGIFTDLGGLYSQNPTPQPSSAKRPLHVFAAQVIEVVLSSKNKKLYKSPKDIGMIRFRDLVMEQNKPEDELRKVAYPLDRSIARYPLPGEQVIIYSAYGEAPDSGGKRSMGHAYFYSCVVSTLHNVTYNMHPFIGTSVSKINPLSPLDRGTATIRFDKSTTDPAAVKNGTETKIYKQLQPFEGDFILQGRFGNSIRFGSTKTKTAFDEALTPDNVIGAKGGTSGDGFICMRVDVDNTTTEKDMLVTEDIDADDSMVLMTTTQEIGITLACSKDFFTWQYIYDLPVDNQESKPDGSMRWAQFMNPIPTTNEKATLQVTATPKVGV